MEHGHGSRCKEAAAFVCSATVLRSLAFWWLAVSIFFRTNLLRRVVEETALKVWLLGIQDVGLPCSLSQVQLSNMAQAHKPDPVGVLFWAGTSLVEMFEGMCG